MPLLPLPQNGAAIDAGDLPIVDSSSIAALEPYIVRESDTAPVRDAIRAALVAMFTYYQDQTSGAAMQSNVLYATGIYLDGLGRDEGVFRDANSEPYTQAGDSSFRARIIMQGGTVTPNIILAAVNSLIAPYTDIPAYYLESLMDRGYCREDTTTQYIAFVRNGAVVGNVDPSYQDRLYPNDAGINLGVSLPNRRPGGFFCFSDCIGRMFIIRIPPLTLVDSAGAFGWDGEVNDEGVLPEALGYNGIYCTDGSVVPHAFWSFLRDAPATSIGIYQAIVNTVNRLIGHSVRWELVTDSLTA